MADSYPAVEFDNRKVREHLKLQVYTFKNLDQEQRKAKLSASNVNAKLLTGMCGGSISDRYIRDFIWWARGSDDDLSEYEKSIIDPVHDKPKPFDHMIVFSLQNTIISFAILNERDVVISRGAQRVFNISDRAAEDLGIEIARTHGTATRSRTRDAMENVQRLAAPTLVRNKDLYLELVCNDSIKGVGTIILKSCESLAVALGIGILSLSSIPSAYGFYAKKGYKEIGNDEVCDTSVSEGTNTAKKIIMTLKNLFDESSEEMKRNDPIIGQQYNLRPEILEALESFLDILELGDVKAGIDVLKQRKSAQLRAIGQKIYNKSFDDVIEMSKCLSERFQQSMDSLEEQVRNRTYFSNN